MEKNVKDLPPLDISHVCVIVKDREEAMQRFGSLWRIGPFGLIDTTLQLLDVNHLGEAVPHGGKQITGKLAFAQAGPIEIELIEPGEDEQNIWGEFLSTRGAVVHHLAVDVPDLDTEIARLKGKGVGILLYAQGEHVKLAYMDTEKIIGVTLELRQALK